MFDPQHYRVEDEESGLLAFIVIDDTSLGPAAGGIRTRAYPDEESALADAHALARAMTYKCALAGLPAGGGKGVVMLRESMRREAAFEHLGGFIESLGGRFLTAGDLGTTPADLHAMSRRTSHVYTDEAGLAGSVGLGCVRAMQACIAVRSPDAVDLAGTRVAVQGCGTVGAAVARAAAAAGAEVLVADLDAEAAAALSADLSASIVDPDRIFAVDAEILAPCAVGGVVSSEVAGSTPARAICGAANNILAAPEVEAVLAERGVLWVPDPLSSAGAVIEGVGRRVMGLTDCSSLIDRIFDTTRSVLEEARRLRRPAGEVAAALAESRIRERRRSAG